MVAVKGVGPNIWGGLWESVFSNVKPKRLFIQMAEACDQLKGPSTNEGVFYPWRLFQIQNPRMSYV